MALTENFARVSTRLLIKLHSDEINEALFLEGSVGGLLIEALDDEDKAEMQKAVDSFKGMATELTNSLPKTPEWEEVVKPIIDATAAVSTDELYDESGDPKARADAAAEVTKILQDAMGEMAAIIQCVQAVKDEVSKSKPEDASKTIGGLSKDSDGTDFPTAEDLTKSVEKAYQIPDWFNKAWQTGSKAAEKESGGIFKKIGNFLKGLFGGDETGNLVDATIITAAIMSSPFEEFVKVNLSGVQKNLVTASEAVGAETGEAAAGAAASQSGQDAATSGKADVTAGKAGAEALAKDKDAAKGILDALKDLGPEVLGAVEAALAGKIEDLPPNQQNIASRVLAMYQGGPDGATPEQAVDTATDAVEDADKELASAFKNIDALADLGDKHMGDGGGATVKAMLSDPDVAKLFAHKSFQNNAYLHENSLMVLLEAEEEGVALEDLIQALATAAGPDGKPPDEAAVTAWATDVNDQELLDKKIAISAEGEEGEEGAPVSDEEAEEEQALADDALKSAAEAAAAEAQAPAVAIATALDAWVGGLSKTSQTSLTAKGRMDGLKDLINTALEDAAKALEGEVAAAVGLWRGEHEETLMKSKRFAQKNFDSLEQMIPAIAAAMLKKTSETNVRLTRGMVRKSVFKYLDKKFNRKGVLVESTRWEQLAGLRRR
jgi:hypothetical protein